MCLHLDIVAPDMGAWIEIKIYTKIPHRGIKVAPDMGAWIEIGLISSTVLLRLRRSRHGSVD